MAAESIHHAVEAKKKRGGGADFLYLLGSMDSLFLGRGTSTPTSSIAGARVAGGARRVMRLWEENLVALSAPMGKGHGPGPVSHGTKGP